MSQVDVTPLTLSVTVVLTLRETSAEGWGQLAGQRHLSSHLRSPRLLTQMTGSAT